MSKMNFKNAYKIAENLNYLMEKRQDTISWYKDIDRNGEYLKNLDSESNVIYKTIRRLTSNTISLLSTLTDSQKTLIFVIDNKKTTLSKATINIIESLAIDLGVDNAIIVSLDDKLPGKNDQGRFYDRKNRPLLEFFKHSELLYNPFKNLITRDVRIHDSFSSENPGLSKKELLKVTKNDIICRYLGATSGDVIRYEMVVFLPTYEISTELIFRYVV